MPPKTTGTSVSSPANGVAVVLETSRARVSIEIERMTKGPAKVSVRVDGDDSNAAALEALQVYEDMIIRIAEIESTVGDGG